MNTKPNVKHTTDTDKKGEHAHIAALNILDEFKEKAQHLSEKAKHLQEDTTNYVKDNYEKVKNKSGEIEEKVTSYVKKNPLKVVGFSILAGAILSKIFRRRR